MANFKIGDLILLKNDLDKEETLYVGYFNELDESLKVSVLKQKYDQEYIKRSRFRLRPGGVFCTMTENDDDYIVVKKSIVKSNKPMWF